MSYAFTHLCWFFCGVVDDAGNRVWAGGLAYAPFLFLPWINAYAKENVIDPFLLVYSSIRSSI